MSLSGTRTRLEALTKELLRNWEETRTDWRDAQADAFGTRYVLELRSRVDKTVVLLEKLDVLLNRVRNDCE